ncbi:hypothetical protein [Actinomyces wuliandei]|uniref:hypothetical protein n=1 Tax=Actinomyces wuliandei TaxID=2057743 RepID=UPI000FD9BE27|nr:hypothetical protein [Actinomyces wuliandei]
MEHAGKSTEKDFSNDEVADDGNEREVWEYGDECRTAFWAQYGEVSPMAYFGPTNGFMSPWPGKAENFVPVWLPDSTIVTTSGLSSPWSEEGGDPGEGLEFYIDSPRLAGITLEDIATTWELVLLMLVVSHQAGQNYRPTYDHHGCLTLSGITDTGIPEDWLDEDGGLGVLLGASAGTRPDYIKMFGDTSAVRLISVAPLRPSELAEIHRTGRRREAGQILTASPYRNQVHLDRPLLLDRL